LQKGGNFGGRPLRAMPGLMPFEKPLPLPLGDAPPRESLGEGRTAWISSSSSSSSEDEGVADPSDPYESLLGLSSRTTVGPFLTCGTTGLDINASPFDSFTTSGASGLSFLMIVGWKRFSVGGLSEPSYLLVVDARLKPFCCGGLSAPSYLLIVDARLTLD